jgi:small subunit ribosomal protein S28e
MASKKGEEKQEVAQTKQEQIAAEEEKVYIAQVTDVYNRTGAGGDVNICRVLLKDTGKAIFRAVQGPVAVGHLLALRECVREARKSR